MTENSAHVSGIIERVFANTTRRNLNKALVETARDAEAEATASALQVAAAADGTTELKAPPMQSASGESSGRGLVSTVAGVAGALIVVAAAAIGIALMLRRSRFGAAADMSAAAAIELPEEGGVVASQSAYTIQV